MLKTFSVFLLLCSSLYGQVTCVITGPSKSNPGDLVVLELETNATAIVWSLGNSDKTFLPVEQGRKVVFASGRQGKYKFTATVFRAEYRGGKVISYSNSATYMV